MEYRLFTIVRYNYSDYNIRIGLCKILIREYYTLIIIKLMAYCGWVLITYNGEKYRLLRQEGLFQKGRINVYQFVPVTVLL